jgi:hypothetical protein
VSERRGERSARQGRAEDAIERYAASVLEDLNESLRAGIGEFRTQTRDRLMERADDFVLRAHHELDDARRALDNAEAASDRLAEARHNVVEIDELLERIRRLSGRAGTDRT